MQINELKDRLFNILNDTENSFMADIITNEEKDEIKISLKALMI